MVAVLSAAGCSKTRLVHAPCSDDSACDAGFLCDAYECVPSEAKACDVVTNGTPILEPSPYAAEFGDLTTADAGMTITLNNIGNCTLTLFEASIDGGATSPFSCDFCNGNFPIEIFPQRSRDVPIVFTEQHVGRVEDALVLLSDDHQFPQLSVPLHANFLGIPDLVVAPNPVDFGYVAQGLLARKNVQISNTGTGVATVTVQSVVISPPMDPDFQLSAPVMTPTTLNPISGDQTALITFEVQFHPTTQAQLTANLVVTTDQGVVTVPLKGNSATPAKIAISPGSINLGQVQVGQSNHLPLTITNSGGVPLNVNYVWGGPSCTQNNQCASGQCVNSTCSTTDLWAAPTALPAVAPGQYLIMQVAATPSAPGTLSGVLVFSSNDPSNPSINIPVTATAVPGTGPEVLKVDMKFQGGSTGTFTGDIRSVDMDLEDPFGDVCGRQAPTPTTWGGFGTPTWISFGPSANPQRVVLVNAMQDGTYRVMLQYTQDCSSLPTGVLAGILGVSVDALIGYLTGGAGLAGVNPAQIQMIISQICFSHDSTNATVDVSVNGTVINETTTTLNKMGDTAYAVDVIRDGGVFTAQ